MCRLSCRLLLCLFVLVTLAVQVAAHENTEGEKDTLKCLVSVCKFQLSLTELYGAVR